MIPQLNVDSRGEHLLEGTEKINPQLYKFFQQLLENIVEHPDFQSAIPELSSSEDVMMEFHVNGVRYTFHHSPAPPAAHHASLSPREREIVRLVAKGLPTKVIAITLDVSPWTVCTHMRRIFTKLGVKSRAEMVASALKYNVLE